MARMMLPPGFLVIFSILCHLLALADCKKPACHEGLSEKLIGHKVYPNGTIVSRDGFHYKKGTYWKHQDGFYYGCPCNVARCLRKCPPEYFGNDTEIDDTPFQVSVWENGTEKLVHSHSHFRVFTNKMCEGDYASALLPLEEPMDEFKILSNGSLQFTNVSSGDTIFGADYFCVHKTDDELLAIICLEEAPEETENKFYIYPVLMLISAVFLIATLVAYMAAPEMRNLHGRCMACQCGSMLVGYLGMATIQLGGHKIVRGACYVLGFITYFSLMATFFWLNIMCFDIWWTFGGFGKMARSVNQTSKKKFILYSIYSWSIPTLLFIVVLIMNEVLRVDSDLRPGLGDMSCWFHGENAVLIYFYAPLSLVVLLNIYFFISTTVKILLIKKETSMLQRGDSKKHITQEAAADKQRFIIYLKLFLVMGLSWTLEIISKLVQGREEIWYIFDAINCLQGVFIFILCVWTTKVRDSALKRLCPRLAPALSMRHGKSAVTKTSENASESSAGVTTAISMKQIQVSEE